MARITAIQALISCFVSLMHGNPEESAEVQPSSVTVLRGATVPESEAENSNTAGTLDVAVKLG